MALLEFDLKLCTQGTHLVYEIYYPLGVLGAQNYNLLSKCEK